MQRKIIFNVIRKIILQAWENYFICVQGKIVLYVTKKDYFKNTIQLALSVQFSNNVLTKKIKFCV